MSSTATAAWEAKRTAETRQVEDLLNKHFNRADSYRYNSASIRIRVVDARFESMSREQRDSLVEPFLEQLPPDTQRDIISLFTFAPSELSRATQNFRAFLLNSEFEAADESSL